MSASGIDSVTSLNAGGVQTQSANGGIPVSSLSGGVSTMSSSYGGITCYKKACDSGYYLDQPSSTYFTQTSTPGTIDLTCYKATGCKAGYYNGGSSYDYHGFKCSPCTYSCSSGYTLGKTSSSCGSGYTYKSTSATTQTGCPSKTCGKCTAKTCSDYGLYSSSQSGMSCSSISKDPNLTCYSCTEECKYKVSVSESGSGSTTVTYTASLDSRKWSHPEITVTVNVYIVNNDGAQSGYKTVTIKIPLNSQTGKGSISVNPASEHTADWYINSVSPTSYGDGNGINCTISY